MTWIPIRKECTEVSLHNNMQHATTYSVHNVCDNPSKRNKSGKKCFVVDEWNFNVCDAMFLMEHHRKANDEVTADKKTCRLEFFSDKEKMF